MNEGDNDRIDKLNQDLYSPNAPEVNKIFKRGINDQDNTDDQNTPKREWGPIERPRKLTNVFAWTTREQPIFKKILWFALGFFVLCLIVGTYIYIKGVNTVSANKIDINISAPISVSASNPLGMDISVTNRNNTDLSNVDILIDYPDGTREVDDNTRPFVADQLEYGPIGKGQVVRKHTEAVLFGQEGEKKTIGITLHYKVPGSTSVFDKTTSYVVTINSAPVTLRVDSVKEINSNQEVIFDIKVTSNSATVLKNVAILPTFPFGFTLESSDPSLISTSTSNSNRMWIIDELSPAETKEFKLSGLLKGEKDEDKDFKFVVGSPDPSNPQRIATEFVTVDRLIKIQSPFISTTIAFNGRSGETSEVISAGQVAIGSISFKNNLSTSITDLELILKLNANDLIDKNKIQASGGFYSSLTNTIIWDKKTRNDFESLAPGQGGTVSFGLPFIDPSITALRSGTLKDLVANFDLTIHGTRLSDANVPEQITLLDSKAVKIGTEVTLTPKVTYYGGPFTNTGGVPPTVNKPTTYTVTLSLSNTLNNVQNGVMTATLPPYVNFEGSISPSNEQVVFNKSNNQITWNTGTIFSGQGYKNAEKQVSFKIIFTPSANQVATTPTLIDNMIFQGVDSFTGQKVISNAIKQNTELSADPQFHRGDGRVKQ